MTVPWIKPKPAENKKTAPVKKAVAYYRHSAQDKQENSIEIQQDQVRKFAAEHSIEIIKEFADRGKTGLLVEGRDAFKEMIYEYVEGTKTSFDYVLVLDVSRWGRFQDTDLSAYYMGLCLHHGKRVIFTTIGIPKQDDLLHGIHLSIERYRAASYSRELSEKSWKGSAKIAASGYWNGGQSPYAMQRLLLDEQRKPLCVLKRYQHKAIHNQRVILVRGDENEAAIVRRIFDSFVRDKRGPVEIAIALNDAGVPSPSGNHWGENTIRNILRGEIYAGTTVWNRTSQKMHSRVRPNPASEWIRAQASCEPIVTKETFELARKILRARGEQRVPTYPEASMLHELKTIYNRYGTITRKLVCSADRMPSTSTFQYRFGTLNLACQAIFREHVDRIKLQVFDLLKTGGFKCERSEDFLLIEGKFSIVLQPSVPFEKGYEVYWVFYPDQRPEIDLTIGIPLSCPEAGEILGYLAFPRILCKQKIRIRSNGSSTETALYAYPLLSLIQQLLT